MEEQKRTNLALPPFFQNLDMRKPSKVKNPRWFGARKTERKKPMTLRSYSPSEVEEYHRLPLKEKRTLQQMSKKNIAERASDYFEREASALLRQT
ncbi:hypothetical protein CTI12_AA430910 [Artemisia annua]|uniref:Uncharacterized protein n=1 Tax=Artemisia annua TaxID=35608 RepID=A0A2U1M1D5_ARTAN|nr:hypothetical protein CTI12_AA430910 [Artemisia annua]